MSVCFVDINNLKTINDTYGHPEGDHCITMVARSLSKGVRRSDSVVRYGGDEFFVIFSGVDETVAGDAMRRILEKLDQHNENSGKPYNVNFCYGVCEVRGEEKPPIGELIETADRYMYAAKTRMRAGIPDAHHIE
jgi:diguanylate cyclase (GGDEF)-like protein